MSDLVRFGLQWSGPKDFICTETADGYWTPWHIAQAQLAAEREKVRVLREAAERMYKAYMEGGSCAIIAAVHDLEEVLQATAPEPVAWEYYYKTKGCSAKNAHDPDCICWHKEGTGPYDNERHDSTSSPVIWRLLTSPHQQQVVEP